MHIDLDAFFCAVEELRRPYLKDKPFAVGGSPKGRGVVSSCSYAARSFGVHSAMPMKRALKICPQLIVVKPEPRVYQKASQKVFSVLADFTPLIEQISIDEAFLDLSDLPEDEFALARQIQERIWLETKLPCSIGVATNKLVAKIAT
ncbi:MAG: DNA polymerase IV, partial [Anaerolineales bacterium]